MMPNDVVENPVTAMSPVATCAGARGLARTANATMPAMRMSECWVRVMVASRAVDRRGWWAAARMLGVTGPGVKWSTRAGDGGAGRVEGVDASAMRGDEVLGPDPGETSGALRIRTDSRMTKTLLALTWFAWLVGPAAFGTIFLWCRLQRVFDEQEGAALMCSQGVAFVAVLALGLIPGRHRRTAEFWFLCAYCVSLSGLILLPLLPGVRGESFVVH